MDSCGSFLMATGREKYVWWEKKTEQRDFKYWRRAVKTEAGRQRETEYAGESCYSCGRTAQRDLLSMNPTWWLNVKKMRQTDTRTKNYG